MSAPSPSGGAIDSELATVLVNRRAGGIAAATSTGGLGGGVFHAFTSDPHVTAETDEGVAGRGKDGRSGQCDQGE